MDVELAYLISGNQSYLGLGLLGLAAENTPLEVDRTSGLQSQKAYSLVTIIYCIEALISHLICLEITHNCRYLIIRFFLGEVVANPSRLGPDHQ